MEPALRTEIRSYYEHAPERDRLELSVFQLEFTRTKEMIERFLPEPPALILDIGGGPGRYAAWLTALGYEVHLIDPVRKLVEEAREMDPRIATCNVGDARSLPFENGIASGVLLLGPLYHLTSEVERLQALREAYRVLVPGGLLFAASISRMASTLDGLSRDLFADPAFSRIAECDLSTGVHENPTENPDYFTTAKFHDPVELANEVNAAGFNLTQVLGIEGPGWLFADFDERWQYPRRREDLLRVARAFEAVPSVQGISAHLLAVTRRP